MTPIKHPACNDTLGAPEGMPPEDCAPLPILRDKDVIMSFWKPSAEELCALVDGGSVGLIVVGQTHAPVNVIVAQGPLIPLSEKVTTEEGMKKLPIVARHCRELKTLCEKFAVFVAKQLPDNQHARQLCDELLDISTTAKVIK